MERNTFRLLLEANKNFISKYLYDSMIEAMASRNWEAMKHHQKTGEHLNTDYQDLWDRVEKAVKRYDDKHIILCRIAAR